MTVWVAMSWAAGGSPTRCKGVGPLRIWLTWARSPAVITEDESRDPREEAPSGSAGDPREEVPSGNEGDPREVDPTDSVGDLREVDPSDSEDGPRAMENGST